MCPRGHGRTSQIEPGTHPGRMSWSAGVCLAGRQGFEPGAGPVSNMVMARDFWSKRLNHRRLHRSVSFTAVHPSPPDSAPVVETFWRRCRRGHERDRLATARV